MSEQPMSRTRAWIDSLSKIAGVIAVIFAGQQYLDRQKQARIERTLEYVTLYVDGGGAVAEAQRELSLRLTRAAPVIRKLRKDMLARPDAASEARRRFILALLYGTDEKPGVLPHQITLLHFFESVEICVADKVCDETTALAFFALPVTDYWQNFCSVVLESRDLDPNWGKKLEAFVVRTKWDAPKGLNC